MKRLATLLALAATMAGLGSLSVAEEPASLPARNERLLQRLQQAAGLDDDRLQKLREIFRRSGFIGQGNPAVARHPMTPDQCRAIRDGLAADADEARFERICGAPNMAPLFDPAHQAPEQAPACIDRYEFPGLPCEYPVVWVRAREAAEICSALGKRLCDAHEWEGACHGALLAPDYRFDLAHGMAAGTAVQRMRDAHNRAHAAEKRWSYGSDYQAGVCAAASAKSPGCAGGGWSSCGSNTYPTGAFPACRSPLGVYDLNGNAAEHMNLPLDASQMASAGSTILGVTEMKGSWFIFDSYRAHDDWCRWRAPFWHGSRVLDPASHANYHLGFRCCKSR